jgi:hypothetical protein
MKLAQKFLNLFYFTGYIVVGKLMAVLDILCRKCLEFPRKSFALYFPRHQ